MKKTIFLAMLFLCQVMTAKSLLYEPRFAKGFTVYELNSQVLELELHFSDSTIAIKRAQKQWMATSVSIPAFLIALDIPEYLSAMEGKKYLYNDKSFPQFQGIPEMPLEAMFSELGLLKTNYLVFIDDVRFQALQKKEVDKINLIPMAEYLEPSLLARLEWVILVGYLSGKETKAKAYFDEQIKKWGEHELNLERANTTKRVISGAPFRELWHLPGEKNYWRNAVNMSGATWVLDAKTQSESTAYSLEDVLRVFSDVDIWLHPGVYAERKELQSAVPHLGAFISREAFVIYQNDKQSVIGGGNNYYEQGLIEPWKIQSDLNAIVQGNEDELYFYRELK